LTEIVFSEIGHKSLKENIFATFEPGERTTVNRPEIGVWKAAAARNNFRHEMKKERHKWEILPAEVKVEGQQLRDLNRDIAESERLFASMNSPQAA